MDNFAALLYEAQKRRDYIRQLQQRQNTNSMNFQAVKLPENQGMWGALQGEKNSVMSAVNGL